MGRKAIIAGASGMIGSELLQIILQDDTYSGVLVIVRKKLSVEHKKLFQLVIDFNHLDKYTSYISGDVLFCCLGSTRKKTPVKSLYYQIDHDFPVNMARLAAKNGVKQFHLVSAIGADPHARNFYSKMKGETARDILQMEIPSLYIYEPSLLTGEREENRTGERFAMAVMKVVDPILFGSWKKYRSVPAKEVARVMFQQSIHGEPGKWRIQFTPPGYLKESY